MEHTKEKQYNVSLYPKYKMFSWDMLFYYAIIFLFFTEVKHISAADVFLAESAYPLFKVLFLIPATILISKLGKRKSLIIANTSVFLSILTYILSNDFWGILLGELFSAIGYITKGICETNMLYDSLEKNEKRGSNFSKIDGKASSLYYYIDAITTVMAGFLFAVNGYAPMICCLLFQELTIFLSFRFKEIDFVDNQNKVTLKNELKEVKKAMKGIFNSSRLKSLILFGATFSGILGVLTHLRSSLLSDINVPAQYFGVIFAIFGMISGISAKNQSRFHKKFRNKTLASLSVPVVISWIVLGIWCNLGLPYYITLVLVLAIFLIQYIAKGPFYTLIRQYLNNFTNTDLRNKISSSYNLIESVLRALISFSVSLLLRYTTTSNVFIILGCIFTAIIVLMLDKMRTRVGLKPEEYKEKDIKILELK